MLLATTKAGLDYFGNTAGPVGVFDALDPLMRGVGQTDGPVSNYACTYNGVPHRILWRDGQAKFHPTSAWIALAPIAD